MGCRNVLRISRLLNAWLHVVSILHQQNGMLNRIGVLRGIFLFAAIAGLSAAQTGPSATQPITAGGRFEWAITSTISLPSFGGGVVSSGFGIATGKPSEYGVNLRGFGKRFGLRLTGVATSNTMEAGLGGLWGEDPRYQRAMGQPFGSRIGHVLKMTFMAPNRDGGIKPAYARYAAIGGSNVISNTWRPDSDATVDHTVLRVGLGFLGRMTSNTFFEFWPDVKDRFFH